MGKFKEIAIYIDFSKHIIECATERLSQLENLDDVQKMDTYIEVLAYNMKQIRELMEKK